MTDIKVGYCLMSDSRRVRKMDSKATTMKVELESFINKGLREGWAGWPTKTKENIVQQELVFVTARRGVLPMQRGAY
jgi:hypothetical protein